MNVTVCISVINALESCNKTRGMKFLLLTIKIVRNCSYRLKVRHWIMRKFRPKSKLLWEIRSYFYFKSDIIKNNIIKIRDT